jgi:hypothetical protein
VGKCLGREVDHSLPSGVDVKNEAAPLLPPYTLIACGPGQLLIFGGGGERRTEKSTDR